VDGGEGVVFRWDFNDSIKRDVMDTSAINCVTALVVMPREVGHDALGVRMEDVKDTIIVKHETDTIRCGCGRVQRNVTYCTQFAISHYLLRQLNYH
jgi:hypothetical protein